MRQMYRKSNHQNRHPALVSGKFAIFENQENL